MKDVQRRAMWAKKVKAYNLERERASYRATFNKQPPRNLSAWEIRHIVDAKERV